jgi:hypothetical protein
MLAFRRDDAVPVTFGEEGSEAPAG